MSFLDDSKAGRAIQRRISNYEPTDVPFPEVMVGICTFAAGLIYGVAHHSPLVLACTIPSAVAGGFSPGLVRDIFNAHSSRQVDATFSLHDENGREREFRVKGMKKDITLLRATLEFFKGGFSKRNSLALVLPAGEKETARQYLEDLAQALPRLEIYDGETGAALSALPVSRTYKNDAGKEQVQLIGTVEKALPDVDFQEGLRQVEAISPADTQVLRIVAPVSRTVLEARAGAEQSLRYLEVKADLDAALSPSAPVTAAPRLRVEAEAFGRTEESPAESLLQQNTPPPSSRPGALKRA